MRKQVPQSNRISGMALRGGDAVLAFAVVMALWLLAPLSSQGQTFTVVCEFAFTPGCSLGNGPYGPLLLDTAGDLYGTTNLGGAAPCECGTVFKLDPTVDTGTVLYSFMGGSDGQQSTGGLVRDPAVTFTVRLGGVGFITWERSSNWIRVAQRLSCTPSAAWQTMEGNLTQV